jgi:hypothetical protein
MSFTRPDFPAGRQPPADKGKLLARHVMLSDRAIEAVKFGSEGRCFWIDIAGVCCGRHSILLRGSRLAVHS